MAEALGFHLLGRKFKSHYPIVPLFGLQRAFHFFQPLERVAADLRVFELEAFQRFDDRRGDHQPGHMLVVGRYDIPRRIIGRGSRRASPNSCKNNAGSGLPSIKMPTRGILLV
jgi:hypothetical protein